MNQRIQEIAEACGVYIAYDNRRVTDAELQFFAEQIVLECAEVIEYCVACRQPASTYAANLRSHFNISDVQHD